MIIKKTRYEDKHLFLGCSKIKTPKSQLHHKRCELIFDIEKIGAKKVLDSRKKPTINVFVKTGRGLFETSAPSGKSTGKFEVKSYAKNLESDIDFINKLKIDFDFKKFEDLKKIEKLADKKIGGNSLFALEASLLKALAKENKKQLWKFLNSNPKKFPRPLGNTIGGGLHSKGINGKKPDFQEFLFISDSETFEECVKINQRAYKIAGKLLKSKNKNDEGAWETNKTIEEVLEIMSQIREMIKNEFKERISIGVDIASSSFYKNKKYNYINPIKKLNQKEQINYIEDLINKYDLLYVEDPFCENDFSGFKILRSRCKNCLITGDDLTTTNPIRLKKAIKNKSINAIIVKPNQIGSLLKVKEVIKICKKHNIKTIISHRSGETKDDTIADLAIGFDCDFIKTGTYGKVREAKLKRLIEIEKEIR